MAQIRGTGYGLGGQNTFGGPSRNDMEKDPSPLDAIREQTSKIEDFLDTLSDPVKPYVIAFFWGATLRPGPLLDSTIKCVTNNMFPADTCQQLADF